MVSCRYSFAWGLVEGILVLALVGVQVASAAALFTEDFESQVVSGYSQGTTPAGWVGATQGYRGTYNGLINKDLGVLPAILSIRFLSATQLMGTRAAPLIT